MFRLPDLSSVVLGEFFGESFEMVPDVSLEGDGTVDVSRCTLFPRRYRHADLVTSTVAFDDPARG
jgi:hypothetical protein